MYAENQHSRIFLATILLPLLLFTGCAGGGTTGTSTGNAIGVSGRVALSSGEPLVGATVTLEDSSTTTTRVFADSVNSRDARESAVTDANGRFVFETVSTLMDVRIVVETRDLRTESELGDFSEDTLTIDLELTVENETGGLTVLSIAVNEMMSETTPVEDPDGNAPAPTEPRPEETPPSEPEQNPPTPESPIVPGPNSIILLGTLNGPNGEAVSGASVLLPDLGASTTSNSMGSFRFDLQGVSGTLELDVFADVLGGGSVTISGIPDSNAEISIVLQLSSSTSMGGGGLQGPPDGGGLTEGQDDERELTLELVSVAVQASM